MLYNNKFINLVSIIISIVIFSTLYFCVFDFNVQNKVLETISKISEFKKENQKENNIETKNEEKLVLGKWYIEIPSINLKAPITEGTTQDVLTSGIGHFEKTPNKEGNVGLAAFNKPNGKNFFKNLKDVKIGDEIFYVCENFIETYTVDTTQIILNTNWDYLDSSDENKITLITNIENEPKYRRCVQATAIEN